MSPRRKPTSSICTALATPQHPCAFQLPATGRLEAYASLDEAALEALRAEIGRLISAMRRGAQARAASAPAQHGELPAVVAAAIEIPSFESVHAWAAPGSAGRRW